MNRQQRRAQEREERRRAQKIAHSAMVWRVWDKDDGTGSHIQVKLVEFDPPCPASAAEVLLREQEATYTDEMSGPPSMAFLLDHRCTEAEATRIFSGLEQGRAIPGLLHAIDWDAERQQEA